MKRRVLASVIGLTLLVTLGGGPIAYGQAHPAEIDRPLQQIAAEHPSHAVRVIVQARHAADAINAVQREAGQTNHALPHFGGVAATLQADQVARLAAEPGVVRISLDPVMRAVANPSVTNGPVSVVPQTVGAPSLWSAGDNGRGVAIAVLDSGVQPHADFGTPSRIVYSRTFNQGASSAADQYGHGTWVAGIAASGGASYPGVAPGASIVNLKVSDDTGAAYASDVLQALGWVADNHAAYNIRVVNLSFVSSLAEGYATSLLDAGVEMVWHSGVAVVVSAGNAGANTEQFAPANDPYVITVGASDDAGTPSVGDDTLAWFSSFGLTQDGYPKPDVVAPGRHVVGPLASNGAGLAKQFPARVIGQQYIQLSGTSAAAPVVSGALALLVQAHAALSPDQLKWLVVHTAAPIQGSTAGELNVAAANAVQGSVPRANLGLNPNQFVALAYLAATGQSNVSWDSVSWDSVSWDSVSWDSVSWDSVSWDSVSWDSVSWDSVIGSD